MREKRYKRIDLEEVEGPEIDGLTLRDTLTHHIEAHPNSEIKIDTNIIDDGSGSKFSVLCIREVREYTPEEYQNAEEKKAYQKRCEIVREKLKAIKEQLCQEHDIQFHSV